MGKKALSVLLISSTLLLSTHAVAQQKMKVEATAYCLRGKTATGTRARHGVVAVDPRVIPLGSKVHIPGYGWARAEDTGRLIKGRRIDVWLPSRGEAMTWGRRKVLITVVRRRDVRKNNVRKNSR